MKTILDEITKNKFKELAAKKNKRDFLSAIKNPRKKDLAIIAEVKLTSISEGKLGDVNDIVNRVKDYENGFADAISVVVDKKYFSGKLELIRQIKDATTLPILAKDFVIDPYQIYEMKIYGADAILLIVKILIEKQLKEFVNLALDLGLEPVVEVQNKKEMENAVDTTTRIIAVNARDLNNFKIDIDKACSLLKLIPRNFVRLGFSGVKGRQDVKKYKDAGAIGVLVGTSLMKSNNIKDFLMSLRGEVPR